MYVQYKCLIFFFFLAYVGLTQSGYNMNYERKGGGEYRDSRDINILLRVEGGLAGYIVVMIRLVSDAQE